MQTISGRSGTGQSFGRMETVSVHVDSTDMHGPDAIACQIWLYYRSGGSLRLRVSWSAAAALGVANADGGVRTSAAAEPCCCLAGQLAVGGRLASQDHGSFR